MNQVHQNIVIILIAALVFVGLVIFIRRDRQRVQYRLSESDQLKASANRALKEQQLGG